MKTTLYETLTLLAVLIVGTVLCAMAIALLTGKWVLLFAEFPKTESRSLRQFPAVVAGCDSPEGPGTAGNKPLMRNLRAPDLERHRDWVTAGNTF